MAGIINNHIVPGLVYALIYSIGLFYGAIICLFALYRGIKEKSFDFLKAKNRPLPPKCLNDPELGEHGYIQIKNVKLHFVERGDRTKPLMLFLHGFPESWYSWRYQIKEFSMDYWTVAVDMRGYGESEKPEGYRYYRLRYLLEDVKNLIEALGKEKCIMVGTDWGGVLGWYFLQIYPQYIDSYVFLNSAHPLTFRKLVVSSYKQFKKSWYVFFNQLPYLPEIYYRMDDLKVVDKLYKTTKNVTPEDIEAYKFLLGKPGAFIPAVDYYRANVMPDMELSRRRTTDHPAPRGLFLFGNNDDYIDVRVVEKTKRMYYNLTTEIIQGASHFVQQDEYETVNRLMREFLKSGYEERPTSD